MSPSGAEMGRFLKRTESADKLRDLILNFFPSDQTAVDVQVLLLALSRKGYHQVSILEEVLNMKIESLIHFDGDYLGPHGLLRRM